MPDPGVLQTPPMAPGEARYNAIEAQVGSAGAQEWKVQQAQKLASAGLSGQGIDAYFGDKPVDYSPIQNQITNNIQRNVVTQPTGSNAFGVYDDQKREATNLMEALHAGWDNSDLGLMLNHGNRMYDVGPKTGFVGAVVSALTQTVGDSPYMLAGAVGGSAAGAAATENPVGIVAGGGFGGTALPQAMREAILDVHNAHPGMSWQETVAMATGSAWNTVKAGAVGAISPVVGGKVGSAVIKAGASEFVGGVANVGAQSATAATVGAGMDGRVPTGNDFAVSAVQMLGLHIATHAVAGKPVPTEQGARVQKNLQDIYARTGIQPQEAVKMAETNPTMRDEILGQDTNGDPTHASFHTVAPPDPPPYRSKSKALVPVITPHEVMPGRDIAPQGGTGMQARQIIPQIETGGLKDRDRAISPAGAVGRNQIMPATARQYMGGNFDVSTLTDPKVNQQVYDHIMADLEKRFPGNPEAQAIAYNAGPGRASEYMRAGAGTKLLAIEDKSMRGGVRYEQVDAARDESHLPMETQKYLAKARLMGMDQSASTPLESPDEVKTAEEGAAQVAIEDKNEGAEEEAKAEEGIKSAEQDLSAANAWKGASESDLTEEMLRGVGEQKKPGGWSLTQMKAAFLSELAPAREIDTRLQKAGLYDRDRDYGVEDAFRNTYASDARAGLMFKQGPVDAATLTVDPNGPTWDKAAAAVKAAGGDLDGWTAYRLAKRTVELHDRGMDSGMNYLAAVELANSPEAKAKYDEGSRIWQGVLDGKLKYMRDSGYISADQYDRMTQYSDSYAAMRRVRGEDTRGQGKRGFGVADRLKRFEGSDGQVVNPFLAELDNMRLDVQAADRNAARLHMVTMAERDPEIAAHLGIGKAEVPFSATDDEIDTQMKKYGFTDDMLDAGARDAFRPMVEARLEKNLEDNEFVVRRNGQAEVWKTDDPEVAKMIKNAATPVEMNAIMQVAKNASALMRAGVVHMPDFISRVTGWHQLNMFINDPLNPPPYITWARAMGTVFGGGKDFQNFIAKGGGAASLQELEGNSLQRDIEDIFGKTGTWDRIWNTFTKPVEAMQWLHERVDAATRYGYYKYAQGQGVPDIKAAMMARKAGLDYAERGASQLINQMAMTTAFFRPHLLGLKQTGEAVATHPVGTLTKATLAITLPVIGMYLLNKLADQSLPDDQKYSEIPQWEKDSYLITPPIMGTRIKLKLPANEGFFFGTVVHRLLQAYDAHDPHAMDGWTQSFMHEFMPPLIPTIAQAPTEVIANHDFYTGKPLIPDSLAKQTGPMQYTENTTAPAKALARVLGDITTPVTGQAMSPIQIEHLVNGWAGPVGMTALHVLDAPFSKPSIPDLADNIFVKGYMVRTPGRNSQSIQNFYTDMQDFEAHHADAAALVKQFENGDASAVEMQNAMADPRAMMSAQSLAQVSKAIQMQGTTINAITDDKTMTVDEKRQAIDKVYDDMIQTAKMGEEVMQTLKAMK